MKSLKEADFLSKDDIDALLGYDSSQSKPKESPKSEPKESPKSEPKDFHSSDVSKEDKDNESKEDKQKRLDVQRKEDKQRTLKRSIDTLYWDLTHTGGDFITHKDGVPDDEAEALYIENLSEFLYLINQEHHFCYHDDRTTLPKEYSDMIDVLTSKTNKYITYHLSNAASYSQSMEWFQKRWRPFYDKLTKSVEKKGTRNGYVDVFFIRVKETFHDKIIAPENKRRDDLKKKTDDEERQRRDAQKKQAAYDRTFKGKLHKVGKKINKFFTEDEEILIESANRFMRK